MTRQLSRTWEIVVILATNVNRRLVKCHLAYFGENVQRTLRLQAKKKWSYELSLHKILVIKFVVNSFFIINECVTNFVCLLCSARLTLFHLTRHGLLRKMLHRKKTTQPPWRSLAVHQFVLRISWLVRYLMSRGIHQTRHVFTCALRISAKWQ